METPFSFPLHTTLVDFDRDLKWRTGVEIVPIQCISSNNFQITESALQRAYQDAQTRNLTVKGVLPTNRSNPLGTTITRKELNLLIDFISDKADMHLISDEIYSGRVFDCPGFVSVVEQSSYSVQSLQRLGLTRFPGGCNLLPQRHRCVSCYKMSSFGLVSSQTQHLLSAMLGDKKFSKNYISENKQRLKRRQKMLVSGLKKAGISCLKSNAGLFCWVDMRHLLQSNTFEAEMELWKKIVYDVRLNISPGSSCNCTEPGWFRLCFANMSEDTLDLAMKRLNAFVAESAGGNGRRKSIIGHSSGKKKSPTKWVFRLSSRDREQEDR
ncbi:hypothetical protein K1719_029261 [Acacia pycnantha]|nr:hypothetical protein K1719_029261 [Acacia pycnantha]